MTQAMDLQCHLHKLLRPIKTVTQGVVMELARHSSYRSTSDQQKMSLRAEVELPELCDPKDVTITVLEGQGSLTLHEEVVTLEPGMLVYIPAYTSYMLQASAYLVLMLNRCEPDLAAHESVWIFNL
jgi:mannose-6-phosphate isomerase class I